LKEYKAKYGSVFTLRVDRGKRITYILDPHLFHNLLTARDIDFSPVSRQSKIRFGLGSIVKTDERVRDLSNSLISALRGTSLAGALSRFENEFKSRLQTYLAQERDSTSDKPRTDTVQNLMNQTFMPAIVHGLFGSGIYDDSFAEDFYQFSNSVATRHAGSDPSLNKAGRMAEIALRGRMKIAWEKRESPVVRSLCEKLLDSPSGDGHKFSETDRLQTLVMLLWGSMVNLLPSSAWMYGSVIQDSKLVAELRTSDDLPLRTSVVSETLRLFSKPNMYREVIKSFDLAKPDGRLVRFTKGDWVAIFPRLLHHDPAVFEMPAEFQARRFCPVQAAAGNEKQFEKSGQPLRHSTVVFGLGRGRCPGDGFSRAALDIVLHELISGFDTNLSGCTLPPAVRQTVASTPEPAEAIDIVISSRSCNDRSYSDRSIDD
jgi:cytochrome P450